MEAARTDQQQEQAIIGTITVKTDAAIKTEPQDPEYDNAGQQQDPEGSSPQACTVCKRLKRKLNDKEEELEVNKHSIIANYLFLLI